MHFGENLSSGVGRSKSVALPMKNGVKMIRAFLWLRLCYVVWQLELRSPNYVVCSGQPCTSACHPEVSPRLPKLLTSANLQYHQTVRKFSYFSWCLEPCHLYDHLQVLTVPTFQSQLTFNNCPSMHLQRFLKRVWARSWLSPYLITNRIVSPSPYHPHFTENAFLGFFGWTAGEVDDSTSVI